jgi:hypothetical protein
VKAQKGIVDLGRKITEIQEPEPRMIERYTIKFGPAVSQKELEKALHEDGETPAQTNLNMMKARIEIIADFDDLREISRLLQKMKSND